MRLSLKFGVPVLVILALTMGLMAWILIRDQQKAIEAEVRKRAETVLHFGQACRAYAVDVLRPAVGDQKKDPDLTIFEVQREAVESAGKFDQLAEHDVAQAFDARDAITAFADNTDVAFCRRGFQSRDLGFDFFKYGAHLVKCD